MRAKVLWLIKGLGLGGAEKLLVLAAPYLDRSRFEYEVLFLLPWKTALVPELERAGIPVICLNHRHPFDLRVVPRIARLLRERRVDILHAHLPYSGVVGRVAARLAGTPAVIYTEHNVQQRYHLLTRLINQATLRLCDVTVAVSAEVRASLLRSPLVGRRTVLTILNGVDVEGLRRAAAADGVREEFGILPDRLVVCVVNVFRPQKRLDLWVRAARLIADAEPRATFLVVGDGPIRPQVRDLAGRLGLDGRIAFPGLRHDAARLMAVFDVFMLSSVYEGLPVAVLEAMALGRPVVATRVGGLPGVIQDGRHGFLVPPGDPGALAERVVELLRRPELRQAFGEASAARVRQHFSIERMVRETEHLYVRLLEGSPVDAGSGAAVTRELGPGADGAEG